MFSFTGGFKRCRAQVCSYTALCTLRQEAAEHSEGRAMADVSCEPSQVTSPAISASLGPTRVIFFPLNKRKAEFLLRHALPTAFCLTVAEKA